MFVDSDEDPECYVMGKFHGNKPTDYECVCEGCREANGWGEFGGDDCAECEGNGTYAVADRWNGTGWEDTFYPCKHCEGTGKEPDDGSDQAIPDRPA